MKDTKPNVPSSVFAAGTPAPWQAPKKQRKKPVYSPPDPSKVKIRKGVPLPVVYGSCASASRYAQILDSMAKGDSVVLTITQAKSLVGTAKKLGVKTALRSISKTEAGVWRLS